MIVIYKPKDASFVSLISSALFLSIFVAEKRSSLPFLRVEVLCYLEGA